MAAPQDAGDQRNGGLEAEIKAEQDAVDRAYVRLEHMRGSALDVVRHHQQLSEVGSSQSRVEWESLLALTDQRLQHLELGGAPLCFGRVDRTDGETYQIGRLSVLDEQGDPMVVDWRAPAAEPFYRATGRNPMDLVRRRHLLTRGRVVVGLDDEVFDLALADAGRLEVVGEGALLAALERSRTGRMGDIVATIQSEQDVIIRAPFPGILIVQGGPGTGKTAVALHRAAYLLYTNRQRLEEAGVLVIGPNRTFLRYIEHVLPSLGESGVDLLTIDALYGRARARGTDAPEAERVKGDARMVEVLARAVSDRQRVLRGDLAVAYGSATVRLARSELARIVDQVRHRKGGHNARRTVFVRRLKRALWNDYRRQLERRLSRLGAPEDYADDEILAEAAREATVSSQAIVEREQERFFASIASTPEVRAALERMWPLLTAEQLVHDLFGAPSLLRLASRGVLDDDERDALARPRSLHVGLVDWTGADLALLDEAAMLLGPIPQRGRRRRQLREGTRWAIETVVGDIALQTGDLDDEMQRSLVQRLTENEASTFEGDDDDAWPPAYGHVIVDEAQDYSAMQWRMVARRCPVGSMTIVGDLGQASRAGAISSWEHALAQLPVRREPRILELSINYRTPAEVMDLAAAVLAETDPGLTPPRSVRQGSGPPTFEAVRDAEDLTDVVLEHVTDLMVELGEAKVAVLAPARLVEPIRARLLARGGLDVSAARSTDPLEASIVVFTPVEAKGLEFDGVVLVEPDELVGGRTSGLRGLYVALTRATRRLTIVHHGPLPRVLVPAAAADGHS